MSIKRRLGESLSVLLLATCMTALSAGVPHAQSLSDLNRQILDNPNDVELNLRYARQAEEEGELRHALAAYERVLINDSSNAAARRGYARIRRALEPTYTSLRLELGGLWDSNPRNTSLDEEEAYSIFVRAALTDERRWGERRWRSSVNFEGEATPDIDELNYAHLGAQTGLIIDVAPNLAVIPALGVAVASLDGDHYFSDVNLGVTLEGHNDGASLWARFRAGWRDYSEESTADNGMYAELSAGVTAPRIVSPDDVLVIVPWMRWSDIEGSTFNFMSDELTPGEYSEAGIEATYRYHLNERVALSIGARAYDRYYSSTEVLGDKRHDTYVAPELALTLQNLANCACAIKLAYQYRRNDSNDPLSDYDAQQVSMSLVRQF